MNTIVSQYLDERKDTFFDDMESEFNSVMRIVRQYTSVGPNTRLLEIGSGTGWFQVKCRQEGIACVGLEPDPDLIASSLELGRRHGFDLQVQAGTIEATDIGIGVYDVVIANSVFEHVKDWRLGLAKVAAALKPGGVFFFAGSTNKFSFTSGEYWIPLYGWMPDRCRYAVRRALQGEEIMQWGIDWNQFTYPLLRRYFKQLGYSRVLDRADMLDPDDLNNPTRAKQVVLKLLKSSPVLKHTALTFSETTMFVCIK